MVTEAWGRPTDFPGVACTVQILTQNATKIGIHLPVDWEFDVQPDRWLLTVAC